MKKKIKKKKLVKVEISKGAKEFLEDFFSEDDRFYGPSLADTIDVFCREWLYRENKDEWIKVYNL